MNDCNKIVKSLKTFKDSEQTIKHFSSSPFFALFQGSSVDTFSKTILNEDNKLEFPDVNTYLHDNVD